MGQVTLKINGHPHLIGCRDGEEEHLLKMGEQVEQRVERAKELGAQSGEARLLVMAALLLADELHDTTVELASARKGKAGGSERTKSERMTRLAARAEAIASAAEQH